MTLVVLSLGSNIEREKMIRYALEHIRQRFGELEISPVYETSSVGFDGPPFFNLVAGLHTEDPLAEVIAALREIESGAGRVRGPKSFDSRILDIDVVLYGQEDWRNQGINVPRDEIEKYAYVLKPLSDLYPDLQHPLSGETMRSMWDNFSVHNQTIFIAEFPYIENL